MFDARALDPSAPPGSGLMPLPGDRCQVVYQFRGWRYPRIATLIYNGPAPYEGTGSWIIPTPDDPDWVGRDFQIAWPRVIEAAKVGPDAAMIPLGSDARSHRGPLPDRTVIWRRQTAPVRRCWLSYRPHAAHDACDGRGDLAGAHLDRARQRTGGGQAAVAQIAARRDEAERSDPRFTLRLDALLELSAERRANGDAASDQTVRFVAEQQARHPQVTLVPGELCRILQGAALSAIADDGTEVVVRIPTTDELAAQIRQAREGTPMEGEAHPTAAEVAALRAPLARLGG